MREKVYIKKGGKRAPAFLDRRWVGTAFPPLPIKPPSLIKVKSTRDMMRPVEFWRSSFKIKTVYKRTIKLITFKYKIQNEHTRCISRASSRK